MKHKHYDLIVAKAANMDLVVFSQNQKDGSWLIQNDQGTTDFGDCVNYFLCLPQHKEACLHWLNGGEVQEKGRHASNIYWSDPTDGILWSKGWHGDHIFMCEVSVFRIKPKKEKRWIAYTKDQKRVGVLTFDTEQAIKAHYGDEADSFHEIEVEV